MRQSVHSPVSWQPSQMRHAARQMASQKKHQQAGHLDDHRPQGASKIEKKENPLDKWHQQATQKPARSLPESDDQKFQPAKDHGQKSGRTEQVTDGGNEIHF